MKGETGSSEDDSEELETPEITYLPQVRCEISEGLNGGRKRDGYDIDKGGGKRDWFNIDKMGSFGLWFGDATNSRVAPGGMVFHVLNRGVAGMQLFEKAADYQAFERVLQDTLDQSPMRICAYAVMPPLAPAFVAGVRWRVGGLHATADDHPCASLARNRGYAGLGHVYQGRYKSFPVESDERLRNPVSVHLFGQE